MPSSMDQVCDPQGFRCGMGAPGNSDLTTISAIGRRKACVTGGPSLDMFGGEFVPVPVVDGSDFSRNLVVRRSAQRAALPRPFWVRNDSVPESRHSPVTRRG